MLLVRYGARCQASPSACRPRRESDAIKVDLGEHSCALRLILDFCSLYAYFQGIFVNKAASKRAARWVILPTMIARTSTHEFIFRELINDEEGFYQHWCITNYLFTSWKEYNVVILIGNFFVSFIVGITSTTVVPSTKIPLSNPFTPTVQRLQTDADQSDQSPSSLIAHPIRSTSSSYFRTSIRQSFAHILHISQMVLE